MSAQSKRVYEFSENNSGGSWWLSRADYEALFATGWKYEPDEYDIKEGHDKRPFLDRKDSTVPYGWRHGLRAEFSCLRDAVESWERATGRNFFEEGCNCCGAPYSIHSTGDGEYEWISGDSVERIPVRPW